MLNLYFLFLVIYLSLRSSFSGSAPYALRISCGARVDVHTPPTNTLWYKDFAYTGGIPTNGTRPSFITPPLKTLRYFPLSEGPENCYNLIRVPHGHYLVRIFFGLLSNPSFDSEPLFDISVEGTLLYSLPSGWSNHDDERAFVEALVFLTDKTASLCFHSISHGDPAIMSIEILQVDDKSYYSGPQFGQGVILRTHKRLSCGSQNPKFDLQYGADKWGGDRFWNSITTFGEGSDRVISTKNKIEMTDISPNFYPEALYQTAIVSTDDHPDLLYTMDVEPNRNYSIWLHFAEIDSSVTGSGERIVDILINGDIVFADVDIVNMTGSLYRALVLNQSVVAKESSLTIAVYPTKGGRAIISAVEIFEVILAESKTLLDEVRALQSLKSALGIPLRFGWNGDPCVPQQHPWIGADCQFDKDTRKWVINGLGLHNHGLRGFLPIDISRLRHLQNIDLSNNNIQGGIPSSLGTIVSLEVLDLSYNFFNGTIPESLGQLTSLRRLDLNSNSLFGKVPAALRGRLLHRASFNFTENADLCGIPGYRTCGPQLSSSAKIRVGLGSVFVVLILLACFTCWWKRRQNICRSQRNIAGLGLGLLILLLASQSNVGNADQFSLKISCGTQSDFGYSGGVSFEGSPVSISPFPISTGRLFGKMYGPNNCYTFSVPPGKTYSIRVFFGAPTMFTNPPYYPISIKGTLVHTMPFDWESHEEESFVEVIHKIYDKDESICFHAHKGRPSTLSVELYELPYDISCEKHLKCPYLRTHTRLNFGTNSSTFENYDSYGNRFWKGVSDFRGHDKMIHTDKAIVVSSPRYPSFIFENAIAGTPRLPDLRFIIRRLINGRIYRVILHFCKIDESLGDGLFEVQLDERKVDVVDMVRRPTYTSLTLDHNVRIARNHLMIYLKAREGSIAFVNAIEVFEVIDVDYSTFNLEVSALMQLKSSLQISSRMGWNGDPCSPNIWSGVSCSFDEKQKSWFIDKLNLSHQLLKGSLPDKLSLSQLKFLNLSFNEIAGSLSPLGSIISLETLDLSHNRFSGSIPDTFVHLPRLRVMNLSRNNLSGEVPKFLSSISLSLGENDALCGHADFPPCHDNSIREVCATAVIFVIVVIVFAVFCKNRIAKTGNTETMKNE